MLLLTVVWVILGPIISGELVLVQSRQGETNDLNARTDYWDHGQGMYYDTISDSATNLYKWWTEQYFPDNTHNTDGFQTNYDEVDNQNRRIYETDNTLNYDEYSENYEG